MQLQSFENSALNNIQNQAQMIRPALMHGFRDEIPLNGLDIRLFNRIILHINDPTHLLSINLYFTISSIGIMPLSKTQDPLHCSLCGINTDTREQMSLHMVKVRNIETNAYELLSNP